MVKSLSVPTWPKLLTMDVKHQSIKQTKRAVHLVYHTHVSIITVSNRDAGKEVFHAGLRYFYSVSPPYWREIFR